MGKAARVMIGESNRKLQCTFKPVLERSCSSPAVCTAAVSGTDPDESSLRRQGYAFWQMSPFRFSCSSWKDCYSFWEKLKKLLSSFAPSSLQQVQNLCRNEIFTGSSCFLAALSIYNPFLLPALKKLKRFTQLPSNALPSFEFLCQETLQRLAQHTQLLDISEKQLLYAAAFF